MAKGSLSVVEVVRWEARGSGWLRGHRARQPMYWFAECVLAVIYSGWLHAEARRASWLAGPLQRGCQVRGGVRAGS